ncbi:MAG: hypothetical protein WA148_02070 [Actinomycetota bacterium]
MGQRVPSAAKARMDLLTRLFPPPIRENKKILAQALRWLLVGLFIRLIFMPIAVHGDFLLINKGLNKFFQDGFCGDVPVDSLPGS